MIFLIQCCQQFISAFFFLVVFMVKNALESRHSFTAVQGAMLHWPACLQKRSFPAEHLGFLELQTRAREAAKGKVQSQIISDSAINFQVCFRQLLNKRSPSHFIFLKAPETSPEPSKQRAVWSPQPVSPSQHSCVAARLGKLLIRHFFPPTSLSRARVAFALKPFLT